MQCYLPGRASRVLSSVAGYGGIAHRPGSGGRRAGHCQYHDKEDDLRARSPVPREVARDQRRDQCVVRRYRGHKLAARAPHGTSSRQTMGPLGTVWGGKLGSQYGPERHPLSPAIGRHEARAHGNARWRLGASRVDQVRADNVQLGPRSRGTCSGGIGDPSTVNVRLPLSCFRFRGVQKPDVALSTLTKAWTSWRPIIERPVCHPTSVSSRVSLHGVPGNTRTPSFTFLTERAAAYWGMQHDRRVRGWR